MLYNENLIVFVKKKKRTQIQKRTRYTILTTVNCMSSLQNSFVGRRMHFAMEACTGKVPRCGAVLLNILVFSDFLFKKRKAKKEGKHIERQKRKEQRELFVMEACLEAYAWGWRCAGLYALGSSPPIGWNVRPPLRKFCATTRAVRMAKHQRIASRS